MIRRGTRASRRLALLVAATPALGAGVWIAVLAADAWRDGGERAAVADTRRHVAEVEAERARSFAPLAELWSDYATSEAAGFLPEGDAAATETIAARLRAAFSAAGGRVDAVEPLWSRAEGDGVRRIAVEARGAAPASAPPRLLATLEAEPPFLFVDGLDVAAEGPDRVRVRLRLSGLTPEPGALDRVDASAAAGGGEAGR